MICPNCRENRAHRSRRSSVMDWVKTLVFLKPYRCGGCKKRFYVRTFTRNSLRTPEERRVIGLRRSRRLRKIKQELAVYAVVLVIVFALVAVAMQQRQ